MKKELKDCLPFYLGCQCRVWNNVINDFGAWRKMTCSDLNLFLNHNAKCEIALRPLNDMTEEEKKEIFYDEDDETVIKATIENVIFSPDEFKFLLSKHFDLFGLIEAGLAVDKTTM